MNRSEIVTQLSELYPSIHKKDVDMLMKALFDNLVKNIANGERVEIRGFGCFSLKERLGQVRNPREGSSIDADARHVVYFRAGKELKERVNV